MPVSPMLFKQGMRHLPAGVVLITTGAPGARGGLTATAVMSLTLEPPQLVVAVNHAAHAFPLILRNRVFGVNVLSSAAHALADSFAGRDGSQAEDRFRFGAWSAGVIGCPILADAKVSFECRLMHEFPVATHSLLVGAVEAVRIDPQTKPLLHFDGAWAGLGPHEQE
jgi:flavin reductase (DIM6/NTAB) family NADH-FMN oxidoreductase RutF